MLRTAAFMWGKTLMKAFWHASWTMKTRASVPSWGISVTTTAAVPLMLLLHDRQVVLTGYFLTDTGPRLRGVRVLRARLMK